MPGTVPLDNLCRYLNSINPGLAECALIMARVEYPELDIEIYKRRLDALAAVVRAEVPESAGLTEQILILNDVLFKQLRFTGNEKDYYNPCNSFLNEVIDRRQGIPITLCILYIEVGLRIGLPLEGISFPGHFLVKMPTRQGNVILDPFHDGISLSAEQLVERLKKIYGGATKALLQQVLVSATPQEVIIRLLRNLKMIYLQSESYPKALDILNLMLAVVPDMAEDIRDRGMIYQRLECPRAAAADYNQYLCMMPEASDSKFVSDLLCEMQHCARHLN